MRKLNGGIKNNRINIVSELKRIYCVRHVDFRWCVVCVCVGILSRIHVYTQREQVLHDLEHFRIIIWYIFFSLLVFFTLKSAKRIKQTRASEQKQKLKKNANAKLKIRNIVIFAELFFLFVRSAIYSVYCCSISAICFALCRVCFFFSSQVLSKLLVYDFISKKFSLYFTCP